jgi:hypothetical protein
MKNILKRLFGKYFWLRYSNDLEYKGSWEKEFLEEFSKEKINFKKFDPQDYSKN